MAKEKKASQNMRAQKQESCVGERANKKTQMEERWQQKRKQFNKL